MHATKAANGATYAAVDMELMRATRRENRRAGVYHGNQTVVLRLRRAARTGGQLAVERGDKLLNLRLHLAHFLAHIENDHDAGEVHAQISRQVENQRRERISATLPHRSRTRWRRARGSCRRCRTRPGPRFPAPATPAPDRSSVPPRRGAAGSSSAPSLPRESNCPEFPNSPTVFA